MDVITISMAKNPRVFVFSFFCFRLQFLLLLSITHTEPMISNGTQNNRYKKSSTRNIDDNIVYCKKIKEERTHNLNPYLNLLFW